MDDGRTYREHLGQVAPHSVSAMLELEALEATPLHPAASGVWDSFIELSAHRASSGFGAAAISWQDIDSWQRITGARLSFLEREWVFELDRLFLSDAAEEQKKRAARTKK